MIWTKPYFGVSHIETKDKHRYQYTVTNRGLDAVTAEWFSLDDMTRGETTWHDTIESAKKWCEDEYTKRV